MKNLMPKIKNPKSTVRAAGRTAATKKTAAESKQPKAKRTRSVNAPISEIIGFDYDFGANATESIKLFGDAVVFKLFKAAAQQQLGDFIRAAQRGTKRRPAVSGDRLRAAVRDWTPELKRRGKSPVMKAAKFIDKMTDEEKAEMRRLLNANGVTNGSTNGVADFDEGTAENSTEHPGHSVEAATEF